MLSDREGFTQVPRFILSGGPDGASLYCDYNQYTGIRREDSAMYEIRQLDIPASFMELYSRNGRALESREFVETRFEICDELAHGVSEFCRTLAFKDDLSEEAVLQRCHAGLLQTPDTVSPKEAAWVTHRVAELLQWDQPTLPPHVREGA